MLTKRRKWKFIGGAWVGWNWDVVWVGGVVECDSGIGGEWEWGEMKLKTKIHLN